MLLETVGLAVILDDEIARDGEIAGRRDETPDLVAKRIGVAMRGDRGAGQERALVADAIVIFGMRIEQADHQRRLGAIEGEFISVANQHSLVLICGGRFLKKAAMAPPPANIGRKAAATAFGSVGDRHIC